MAKKDDVTTYTKAELIKALRASVAREAKLQKRVAKLEGASTAVNRELRGPDEDHGVVHVTQEPAAVAEGITVEQWRQVYQGDEQAPPAFPWEPK